MTATTTGDLKMESKQNVHGFDEMSQGLPKTTAEKSGERLDEYVPLFSISFSSSFAC